MSTDNFLPCWLNLLLQSTDHGNFCCSSFVNESHFVDDDEPCYRGVVRGGQFKLAEGTGLATIAFRLDVGPGGRRSEKNLCIILLILYCTDDLQ